MRSHKNATDHVVAGIAAKTICYDASSAPINFPGCEAEMVQGFHLLAGMRNYVAGLY